MQHGRDHEGREQKAKHRRNNVGKGDVIEPEALTPGTPPQHLYGAHQERFAPGSELDEPEPVGDGAEVGPTRRAEERERLRHREERKRGRMTAGSGENLRDRREPELTREDLDEAARTADRAVTGGDEEEG
jgi:hypothetical protein